MNCLTWYSSPLIVSLTNLLLYTPASRNHHTFHSYPWQPYSSALLHPETLMPFTPIPDNPILYTIIPVNPTPLHSCILMRSQFYCYTWQPYTPTTLHPDTFHSYLKTHRPPTKDRRIKWWVTNETSSPAHQSINPVVCVWDEMKPEPLGQSISFNQTPTAAPSGPHVSCLVMQASDRVHRSAHWLCARSALSALCT